MITSYRYRTAPRFAAVTLFIIMTASAVVMGLSGQASAQYPQPTDSFVNDFAGVLSSQDASALRSQLQNLKNNTGVEMTVVTIGSVRDYNTGTNTIENFATGLFNNWGVGDASRNNGVMILLARNDQQVRIELGGAYSQSDDNVMRQIIDNSMLPYFRQNQYSQGLLRGAEAVMNSVAPQSGGGGGIFSNAPQNVPTTSTTYANQPVEQKKSGLSFGKIILIAIAAYIIYRIVRRRARRNNNSGGTFTGGQSGGRGASGSFGNKNGGLFGRGSSGGGFFGGGSSRNSSSGGGSFFGGGSSNNSSSGSSGSSSSSSSSGGSSSGRSGGSSGGGGSSGSW
ncbi:hypothetical protein C4J81_03255 [Deltaproteobacteria bacterium Smac51]|nr:hypothetical protein C4J81_03255 [Deltaproteobacteria bacterium Smac51]